MLTLLIFIPLAAAAAILLGAPARKTSLAAATANLAITLLALAKFQTGLGFQFVSSVPILPDWDLKFLVGADGLSLLMLLLTSIVTLAAIWVTPAVDRMEKQFYACLLFISAGALGAFASLDLFFFYAFHELALIPTFLLIGIWGSGDRQAAAWKITIYLAVGSFILLLGLIGLYQSIPFAQRTFDIPKLQALAAAGAMNPAAANWIYLLLLLGFGILISLFPFHTWAPQAYASAPAPAAMLHAGVLKKFGLYGLLRVALPMLPEAARHWTNLLLVLLIGNIIYVGLATIGQKKLDLMLGYSSVMHMGYVFLGIAAFNHIGLSGAALLMFAHGLSIAALFAVAGQLRQRTDTLDFNELGGLAKPMPVLGLMFGLAAFASIGLPGFANFASEVLVFFGAFKNGTAQPFSNFQIATTLALWGVVISAVYMLRAYRAVFMGPLDARWSGLRDIAAVRLPVAMLLAALLLAGFFPQPFLNMVAFAVRTSLVSK
ncbi:MAG: NADH-quinone oxidoreductase subunit [Chthoniobacter sp.]|nr:NADH-quinone oxidoreductase subunit [Chthoniobacter sp.]